MIRITGWYGPDDCPTCRRWAEIAEAIAERAARAEDGEHSATSETVLEIPALPVER